MTITVKFYFRRAKDFQPDYSKPCEKKFSGKTEAECMRQFEEYKNYHDLAMYTVPYIENVED